MVKREPGNPYDSNAIRINNIHGTQIGHIPRNIASKLASYMVSLHASFGSNVELTSDEALENSSYRRGYCRRERLMGLPHSLSFRGVVYISRARACLYY